MKSQAENNPAVLSIEEEFGFPPQPIKGVSLRDKIENCLHYIDVKNANHIMQYDTKTNAMLKVDLAAINKALPGIRPCVELAVFNYNPYCTRFEIGLLDGYKEVNCYRPPAWRAPYYFGKARLPNEPYQMPQIYEEFLIQLTNGHLESVEYIKNWLACGLQRKLSTVLALVGSNRGIGKGVLAEIYCAIVGPTNSGKLKQQFLSKEFNSYVREKQFCYLDEVSIRSPAEFSAAKMYTNNTIAIEGKGKDAETIPLTTNFMLLNNDQDCLHGVEKETDRQFAVPELTSQRLVDSEFAAKHSIDALLNPDNVRDFALHLLTREKDYRTANSLLKTKQYDRAIKSSKPEWQNQILEDIAPECAGNIFDYQGFKNKMPSGSRATVGREKLMGFCSQHPDLFYCFEKKNGTATTRFVFVRESDWSAEHWQNECAILQKLPATTIKQLKNFNPLNLRN